MTAKIRRRVRGFDLVKRLLAAAAGLDWTPPPSALASATVLAAEIAVASGRGTGALRLLTGRGGSGFSVV